MVVMFNNVGLNHDEQNIMCSKSNERKAAKKTVEVEFKDFFDSDKMFWASKVNSALNLKVELGKIGLVCVILLQSIIF